MKEIKDIELRLHRAKLAEKSDGVIKELIKSRRSPTLEILIKHDYKQQGKARNKGGIV